MPTLEAHSRPSVYDVPPPDEQPDWTERVRKFGEGVVEVTQFISELNEDVTPEQRARLVVGDDKATIEAYATGYLADYKAGNPDEHGIADNSCAWTDAEIAASATHLPSHVENVTYITEENIYRSYIIRKFSAAPDPGIGLKLTLERTMTKQQIEKHMERKSHNA